MGWLLKSFIDESFVLICYDTFYGGLTVDRFSYLHFL